MGLSDDDVREILRIIDESSLDELRIETPEFFLHVLKGAGGSASSSAGQLASAARQDAPPPAPAAAVAGATEASGAEPPPPVPTPGSATPPVAGEGAAGAPADNGLVAIPSPMLGTFYRAESPGAEPFVDIGDRVEPDTTVCIIEVMKMMNSVPAGVRGTIVEICTDNAQLVEYGQPLFRVTPDE